MKNLVLLLAAVALTELGYSRTVVDLSGNGWTADGESVSIPHTWNAWDGADGRDVPPGERFRKNSSGADSYTRKSVTYRRKLPVAKPGKRYFLRFGGASIVTTAAVNDSPVGRHTGAFTAFVFEITEAMRTNGVNDLEVVVDNRYRREIPPVNADFTMYGGLYRGVSLIETDRICINPLSGGSGVRIEADAKTGAVVASVSVLGGTNEIRRFRFADPKLWSPETPNLYSVDIRIDQGGCRDFVTESFGFRTVEFRSDGFYLNGRRRKLRGVNRHQDRRGRGWALSAADDEVDISLLKEMGADAVRTAHYPQSDRVYSLCDRMGLLAWCETPCVNGLVFTPEFREEVWRETREMVDQLGNHPSIFCWSIFNELYNKVEMPEGLPEGLMEDLRDFVKGLDPTRPVVAASDRPDKRRLNAVPEALAFNRYPGWYGGNAAGMRTLVDEVCAKNGRRILGLSEYGAGGSVLQHDDPLARPIHDGRWHPEEYQAYVHRETYRALSADPRIWGTFAWCLADFGSDCRQEGPQCGVNDKGLVTFDRSAKKDAFWFYKANWTADPVLHLVGRGRKAVTNEAANILVFSNVGEASLAVNGRTVGKAMPDEVRSILWRNVALSPGWNRIEVRAAGRSVSTRIYRNPPMETTSIQRRIDDVAASGGGTVTLAAGEHHAAGLVLRSNVTLALAKGAVLKGSVSTFDYPGAIADAGSTRKAIVTAEGAENIAIVGEGTVDGLGELAPQGNEYPGRWKDVFFLRCRNVRIEGVTLKSPAAWTCHFKECEGVVVRGVKVRSCANWNNDGLDIEAKDVLVEDCDIVSDDDGVCLKSDNPDFIVENVTVRNCRISSDCCAFKCGTSSLGGFRNISVSNVQVSAAGRSPHRWFDHAPPIPGVTNEICGLSAVALEMVDGGRMEGVSVRNVETRGMQTPIFIRMGSRRGASSGMMRDILIEDVRGDAVSFVPNSITGVPGRRPREITIRNVRLRHRTGAASFAKVVPECAGDYPECRMFGVVLPAWGWYLRHVDDVTFDNVECYYSADAPVEPRKMVCAEDVKGFRKVNFINNDEEQAEVRGLPALHARRDALELLQTEMYGQLPPRPEAMTVDRQGESVVLNGFAVRRKLRMRFADLPDQWIDWTVFLPRYATNAVPAVVMLNYRGNEALPSDPEGRAIVPLGAINARGYAFLTACFRDVTDDPYRTPPEENALADRDFRRGWKTDFRQPDATGTLMAWAWAIMRGVDLLEMLPEVDARRIVATGWSRLAKAALIAGAFDPRIAVTVPCQTGAGGVPLARRNFGETVQKAVEVFPHWFCPAYRNYVGREQSLPFDQHDLLACVAPRPLLVLGFGDLWYDANGEEMACAAAAPAWMSAGVRDMPRYFRRPERHGLSELDWLLILDFADRAFAARDGKE